MLILADILSVEITGQRLYINLEGGKRLLVVAANRFLEENIVKELEEAMKQSKKPSFAKLTKKDIKGDLNLSPRLNAISDEFSFYISPTIVSILKITGEATFEIDGDIYKLTKELEDETN